jgi:hypothetical protein
MPKSFVITKFKHVPATQGQGSLSFRKANPAEEFQDIPQRLLQISQITKMRNYFQRLYKVILSLTDESKQREFLTILNSDEFKLAKEASILQHFPNRNHEITDLIEKMKSILRTQIKGKKIICEEHGYHFFTPLSVAPIQTDLGSGASESWHVHVHRIRLCRDISVRTETLATKVKEKVSHCKFNLFRNSADPSTSCRAFLREFDNELRRFQSAEQLTQRLLYLDAALAMVPHVKWMAEVQTYFKLHAEEDLSTVTTMNCFDSCLMPLLFTGQTTGAALLAVDKKAETRMEKAYALFDGAVRSFNELLWSIEALSPQEFRSVVREYLHKKYGCERESLVGNLVERVLELHQEDSYLDSDSVVSIISLVTNHRFDKSYTEEILSPLGFDRSVDIRAITDPNGPLIGDIIYFATVLPDYSREVEHVCMYVGGNKALSLDDGQFKMIDINEMQRGYDLTKAKIGMQIAVNCHLLPRPKSPSLFEEYKTRYNSTAKRPRDFSMKEIKELDFDLHRSLIWPDLRTSVFVSSPF